MRKRAPRKHKRMKRLLALLFILAAACWLFPERITTQPLTSAPLAYAANLPWNLTLVNKNYGLPENYSFTLRTLQDDVKVDKRIAADLKRMLKDAKAQGFEVHLNAGYRTSSEQSALFEEKKASYLSQGYDETTAAALASAWVAPPGTSEHELGLAVDIGTETQALYDWLAQESWRYGFIQRYPPDKTAFTGVSHEPWHYRYVGEEAASAMHSQGLCLEEYVQTFGNFS